MPQAAAPSRPNKHGYLFEYGSPTKVSAASDCRTHEGGRHVVPLHPQLTAPTNTNVRTPKEEQEMHARKRALIIAISVTCAALLSGAAAAGNGREAERDMIATGRPVP